MLRFLDYATTKMGMADALRAVVAAGGNPYAESRTLLDDAVERLLAAGDLRRDAVADVGLSGIALAAGDADQRAQAERLVDLMLDGLRYRPE